MDILNFTGGAEFELSRFLGLLKFKSLRNQTFENSFLKP